METIMTLVLSLTYVLLTVIHPTDSKSTPVEVSMIGGIPRADLLCWTCPKHMDNESCNRWAPNLACPQNHTVCQTVHLFTADSMESLSVEKTCVKPSACTEDHVGCELSEDGATKLCRSCCNGELCNEEVPTDMSSAIELSSIFTESSATKHTPLYNHHSIALVFTTAIVNHVRGFS